MEATIFDIKRFAVHDGDGIRTTVFFKGCPLRCRWCHNPEGLTGAPVLARYTHLCTFCGACQKVCERGVHTVSGDEQTHTLDRERCVKCGACVSVCPANALRIYGRRVSVADLMPDLLADRLFYEESGGGVTLSGGECLLQADFCAELLQALKAESISTAVDTSGVVPEAAIRKVLPYTDRFLYDIKHMDPARHKEGTGMDNRQILDNLEMLFREGASVEIRIPFIPAYNGDMMDAVGRFLADRPTLYGVRVLRYHNYASSKYLALDLPDTLPPLPEDDGIAEAKETLRRYGVRVI